MMIEMDKLLIAAWCINLVSFHFIWFHSAGVGRVVRMNSAVCIGYNAD